MKTLPPGCFGKLPLHGDFIASERGLAEIAELDRWLQEGMDAASQKLAGAWAAAFDGAPVTRFLFRSPTTGRLLAGVWGPSRDRVGRRFPMILYATAAEPVAGAQMRVAADGLGAFFAAAESLLARDWRTGNVASFLAAVGQLAASAPAESAAPATSGAVLSGAVLGGAGGRPGDPRRAALTTNLIALGRSDVPRLLLRFPVSAERAEIGAWLDFLGRLVPGGLPTLTLWSLGPARCLQAWFPAPAARVFLPAFLPERTDASVFDLAGPAAAPTTAHERAQLERLAADPGLPLDQWLDELVKRPSRREA